MDASELNFYLENNKNEVMKQVLPKILNREYQMTLSIKSGYSNKTNIHISEITIIN